MAKNVFACGLALAVIALAPSAQAHHSRSGYDQDVTVEVRGEVVDYKFRSPHSSMVVDGIAYIGGVRQGQAVERWEWESEAVPAMIASGMKADTFTPGDSITLRGHPSRKEGFKFAQLVNVVSLNGKPFTTEQAERSKLTQEATSQGGVPSAPDAVGVARIAGRWVPKFVPPGEQSALPLNEAGLAAWRNYDPKRSPANTCETMGVPEIFHAPFYLYDIRLSDMAAVLTTEAYEIRRAVPLSGERVPAHSSGAYGNVQGHVEGDSLVIESSGFPASRWGLGAATQLNGGGADVPSSEQKSLVERYSVSADGRTLFYDYTLSDPAYLREPYDHRIEFLRVPDDTPMYPYECDVESASMFSRDPNDAPLRIGD
jgi:hypothetical protein